MTYLEFKFTLACEGNIRHLFEDFFEMMKHQALVWKVVGDAARAVFLGPVEAVNALDVMSIEDAESGDKTDINRVPSPNPALDRLTKRPSSPLKRCFSRSLTRYLYIIHLLII